MLEAADQLERIEIALERRDALGVLGIARELAAGLNLPLEHLEPRSRELDLSTATVTVEHSCYVKTPSIAQRINFVASGLTPGANGRVSFAGQTLLTDPTTLIGEVGVGLGSRMSIVELRKFEWLFPCT